jgi:hypothetical protein
MIIEDYMNVYGRGWVIIARGDELAHTEIRCCEKIVRGDTIFTIKGVERVKYDEGWWNNRVGLILSPNNQVPDCFEVGDDIEILTNEE